MCTELPTISGGFEEQMRFVYCGQVFRAPCEFCGSLYRSDVWHPCEARTTAIMNRDEARYQAYREKLGTRDNWTGD